MQRNPAHVLGQVLVVLFQDFLLSTPPSSFLCELCGYVPACTYSGINGFLSSFFLKLLFVLRGFVVRFPSVRLFLKYPIFVSICFFRNEYPEP
jgi:hypothetical protein